MGGSLIGGHNTIGQEKSCRKEQAGKEFNSTSRKNMKQRKEHTVPVCNHDDDAGLNNISLNCEGGAADMCGKKCSENKCRSSSINEKEEIPNALRSVTIEDELKQGSRNANANVGGEQALKQKSKS
eukprot:c37759_g1_i1 orf=200-577(+)